MCHLQGFSFIMRSLNSALLPERQPIFVNNAKGTFKIQIAPHHSFARGITLCAICFSLDLAVEVCLRFIYTTSWQGDIFFSPPPPPDFPSFLKFCLSLSIFKGMQITAKCQWLAYCLYHLQAADSVSSRTILWTQGSVMLTKSMPAVNSHYANKSLMTGFQ